MPHLSCDATRAECRPLLALDGDKGATSGLGGDAETEALRAEVRPEL